MKKGWKTYLLYASIIILSAVFVYLIYETVRAKNTGFEPKTLWDWMELLIIPAVLAGGAIWLNRSERQAERQHAEDRAKLEREIATNRHQEAALQTYFDRMTELLLKEKMRSSPSHEVREVAKARTVTVMRSLNTQRNELVLQFLRDLNLINDENSLLIGVNMEGIDLSGIRIYEINLQKVNLKKANLTNAIFAGTNLQKASFDEANLQGAIFASTDLQDAIFFNSDLRSSDLRSSIFVGAKLTNTKFALSKMKGVSIQCKEVANASFEQADLSNANLLTSNLDEKQLANAKSLKGAIMPNGTKHE